jgi:hypothetical protein
MTRFIANSFRARLSETLQTNAVGLVRARDRDSEPLKCLMPNTLYPRHGLRCDVDPFEARQPRAAGCATFESYRAVARYDAVHGTRVRGDDIMTTLLDRRRRREAGSGRCRRSIRRPTRASGHNQRRARGSPSTTAISPTRLQPADRWSAPRPRPRHRRTDGGWTDRARADHRPTDQHHIEAPHRIVRGGDARRDAGDPSEPIPSKGAACRSCTS